MKKRRVPYVEQVQATECGLCAVAMILRYHKSYETLHDLRTSVDTGRDGSSLRQLKLLLEEHQFKVHIYEASSNGLNQITLPAIIFWEKEHFVVLESIQKQAYTIIDPAVGRRVIKTDQFQAAFSNFVLTAKPKPSFEPKARSENPWKTIISDSLINKKLVGQVIVFALLSYLVTLGLPIIVQHIIDTLATFNSQLIIQLVCLMMVLFGIYGFALYMRGQKLIALQQVIDRSLMGGTFSHLLKLPYNFYEVRTSGDLLFRMNTLTVIKELLSEDIITGIIDLGGVLFVAAYMFYLSPVLAGVALLVFILNGIFIIMTRPRVLELNQSEIAESSKLQTIQVESIYSILGVKLAALEEHVRRNWYAQFKRVLGSYQKRATFSNLFTTVTSLVQVGAPFLVLIVGIIQYQQAALTLGEVIAFNSISAIFFSLSTAIFNTYNKYLVASSFLERLQDIREAKAEVSNSTGVQPQLEGDVTLRNVSFSYSKNSQRVLKDINLKIKHGEKIAIVGSSGSGKSTLAKLALGLYTPTRGEIQYDGISMLTLNKQNLRKQMGIVPQDINLFNKSILENIRMNQENISLKDVQTAAKLAQIHEEIEAMPMGYHTLVSEMGLNLSGGQRQRIALARALINKPRVIVLDEATSSLDAVNEQRVAQYLSNIGATRIIIAHRLSTIIDADKIYVMREGRIVEEGKHEELFQRKGYYYQLYAAQLSHQKSMLTA